MASIQTLDDKDRRTLARWAGACAGHVLGLFDGDDASSELLTDALERTRRYGRGEGSAAEEIKKRMVAVKAAKAAASPAGAAAARSIAQASAVAHMGAHALGAAAYAAKAVSLSRPGDVDPVAEEIEWQLGQLSDTERAALKLLPPLGSDSAGPLGEGLLSRGLLGDVIRELQARIA